MRSWVIWEVETYMTRTDYGTTPVSHICIVAIFKTVWAWPITDALFAFFKLFKKLEVTRDLAIKIKRMKIDPSVGVPLAMRCSVSETILERGIVVISVGVINGWWVMSSLDYVPISHPTICIRKPHCKIFILFNSFINWKYSAWLHGGSVWGRKASAVGLPFKVAINLLTKINPLVSRLNQLHLVRMSYLVSTWLHGQSILLQGKNLCWYSLSVEYNIE